MFYTAFPEFPIMSEPVPRPAEPNRDGLRLRGDQKAVYDIDKNTHRVRFVDENEERVRLIIEPKD